MVDTQRQYDRSIESLRAALARRVGDPELAGEPPRREEEPPIATAAGAAWHRPWWVLAASLLGLCAGVALIYFAFTRSAEAPRFGGFSRVLSLSGQLDADDYLAELAAAAEDYLAAGGGVQEQMRVLEEDCAAMRRLEHTPLEATDRDWLQGRFAEWERRASEIAKAGDSPVARGQARELLVEMVDTLHRRAALIATR